MTICYTDRTINGNMTITQILDVSGNASLNNVTVNSLSGNLIGNVTGYVTGTVSSLSNHNTDDLAQGSNKYYSDTLVNTLLGNTNSSGGGVSYNNGVFSIGQAIRPDNSPTFKGMTLTDITDASYGLIDFQHNFGAGSGIYGAPTGKQTMAQIQTHLGGPDSNGGEITFHTKADGGTLGERLRISDTGTNNSNSNFDNKTLLAMNGMLKLERNDAGATSKDTYIYNSMDSTNVDLNIETRTDMGVSFMAEGTTRMRIAEDGNVGIGTTTPTAKLDVSGGIKADANGTGSRHYFGCGVVGDVRYQNNGDAGFAQKDNVRWDKFALLQNTGGGTSINSVTGSSVGIRIGWGGQFYVSATQINLLPRFCSWCC